MKHTLLILATALVAWLSAPLLQAAPEVPEAAPAAALTAPDDDPLPWWFPRKRDNSCQPLVTCACVPDRSSQWCAQWGLNCTDANGQSCDSPDTSVGDE